MTKQILGSLLAAASGLFLALPAGAAELRGSVGVSFHGGMKIRAEEPASFAGSSDLAPYLPDTADVRGAGPGSPETTVRNGSLPARDDITQIKDRTFDNGHVGPDRWTEDPGLPPERQNLTWNWSAQSSGQYDPSSQTLTFTRTTVQQATRTVKQTQTRESQRVEYQTLQNSPLATEEDLEGASLDLMGDWVLAKHERWQGLVRLGFSLFLPEERSWDTGDAYQAVLSQTTTRTTEEISRQTTTDNRIVETYVYDDPYVVVPSVGLPYGGPADPMGGPGPLISALPASYSISQSGGGASTSAESGNGTSATEDVNAYQQVVDSREWHIGSVAYEMELNQQRIWLHPRMDVALGRGFSLFAGPVFSLTLADIDATRTADLVVTANGDAGTVAHSWQDRGDETALLPGIGFHTGCEWSIDGAWFMSVHLGADWIDPVEVDVGPATLQADLDAWQGSIQIGRIF